jgi:DNA-binding NarL/FixJ family response regulator
MSLPPIFPTLFAPGEGALPCQLVTLLIEEFRERRRRRRIPLRGRHGAELTDREWEVLELMRNGASTEEIAARLFISPVTVRTHVSATVASFTCRRAKRQSSCSSVEEAQRRRGRAAHAAPRA